jgi:membrane protein DedA with SNARE-associated domain
LGAAVVTAGYLAGASYAKVEKTMGRRGALVVLAVVVDALVVWRVRKHRSQHRTDNEQQQEHLHAVR